MVELPHGADVYLVGGAVRDTVLGQPVHDRDWVVVGTTPEAMVAAGFTPVGRDFPVFLHPTTHEAYALARTERKQGHGYHGFTFHVAPDVTLEDDLQRRDLTINAMAQTPSGDLIDPYGGQLDCQQRLLRHVSPAFEEDPLRVLRVARFAARWPDFTVAPATQGCMQRMARQGELANLSAERVWQECERACDSAAPWRFFETLEAAGALEPWFHELTTPPNVPNLPGWRRPGLRGAWYVGSLWVGRSQADLAACQQRLRWPKPWQRLAQLCQRWGPGFLEAPPQNATSWLACFNALDAFRRPDTLSAWCAIMTSLAGTERSDVQRAIDLAPKLLQALHDAPYRPTPGATPSGPQIAEAVAAQRRGVLEAILEQLPGPV